MVTTPILGFPDWKKEFHVNLDASCIALGAVLTQLGEEKLLDYRVQRTNNGVCATQISTLSVRRTLQNVYKPFGSKVLNQ